MYERAITGLMLVVALIHLLPISGFFGVERLTSLYDVEISGANMEILMRHRAILAMQPIAFLAAFISLSSFFYLTLSVGGFSEAIRKIVIADTVASVCLVGAIVLYVMKSDS